MFVGAIMPTPLYPLYQHGVRIFRRHADLDLCGLCARQSRGAVVLRPARRPGRPPQRDAAGDRHRHRQHGCVRRGGGHGVAVRGAGAQRLLHWLGRGRRDRMDRRALYRPRQRHRRADRGVGEFLRLRRRAAVWRLARSIRAVAAAAALSRLSGFALRRRRRHPVRARDGGESETFWRSIVAAAARCAAAHQAPVRVACGERLRHVFADRLLRRLDPEPARRKPASIRADGGRRRRVRGVRHCRGDDPFDRVARQPGRHVQRAGAAGAGGVAFGRRRACPIDAAVALRRGARAASPAGSAIAAASK